MSGHPPILRVALAAPLETLFDYLPPPGVDPGDLCPGVRVMVPFGRGRRCGLLVAVAASAAVPTARLRAAEALLDAEPLFEADHLGFLQWTARYYHHPPGEVLTQALPLRLRRGESPHALGEAGWRLTPAGEDLSDDALSRAPRQRQVVEFLRQHPGGVGGSLLRSALGDPAAPLRSLREKGLVEACELVTSEDGASPPAAAAHSLNEQQAAAVSTVSGALGGFAGFLLDGVTGSGKTEVYLQLAGQVIAGGQSVLMLVPEISLTPQLVRRFESRLGDGLALLHSGLNERERELAWQRARLGQARLVIGTRSSVFTPLPDLGLVLVDEEHDLSYKQQDGLRYSARDLAVVRAQRAACPVVLGTATPSLESLYNAREGRYGWLRLEQRAGGAKPPRLDLLDIQDQPVHGGMSPVLLAEVEKTLQSGEQALIFLNRRGFAPVLSCFACGWLSDCPRCDARQTLHAAAGLLWCHHCGAQRRVPAACPECGSHELHPLGTGTERVEQVLAARFPDYPLIRIDRDATRRKGSLDRLLAQARAGGAGLLLGTQMLAKGHHFPDVTLVGILDADGGLFGADYRAAERMAQQILQVAGRAGRGERPGRVLIQTRHPDHPLLQTLVHRGYDAFAADALQEREQAGYPPFGYQALIRAEAAAAEAPAAFLQAVKDLANEQGCADIELWGPVPAPMARRAGRHRAHLLLQSSTRAPLHQLLDRLLPAVRALPAARRVRWSLDVDPQESL